MASRSKFIETVDENDAEGLRHQTAVFKKLIDELPFSVGLQTLPDRRFTLVNKAFEDILSIDRDQVLGQTLQEILPGRDLSESHDLETDAIESGTILTRRVDIVDPVSGEPGAIELRKLAITVDGVRYMLTTSENISVLVNSQTKLKEAVEDAQQANAAKSLFLATMSHEIRTPLNGVLGMAQAMSNDVLTPVQRERLAIVHQSGEALLAILNDILDLSKIEAGKMEIEAVEFDLEELINGAHSTFTALANKKALSFVLDVKGAAGVYHGDPTRIRQVLYNLCSNALKFTEVGHIGVRAAHADGRLHLSVFDTGLGIDPLALSNLFSNFVQADASTTRKFGGTGLGLAICRKLAILMGGDVQVQSQPGVGSTFALDIPLVRLRDSASTATPEIDPLSGEMGLKPFRILAAEDNSVNQLVLKTLLHQAGVEPYVVENGFEALQAWENEDWDIILMDIQMPVMDGPTAARRIRAREVELQRPRTPIIALTANAMSQQVAEYLQLGMDACVTKPIEVNALFRTIANIMDDDSEDENVSLSA